MKVSCNEFQPICGLKSTHTWVEVVGIVPNMGKHVDQILAENLNRLMTAQGSPLASNAAVERKSGVGQATVDRVRKGQPGLSIGKLEALAHAFGLDAWELLNPNFDFAARGRETFPWPFDEVSSSDFSLLTPSDRARLEERAAALIEARKAVDKKSRAA